MLCDLDEISSNSSSSSSSSEDTSETSSDDEEFFLENRIRPKNMNYLEIIVPQYNGQEFMEHFRVSREVYNEMSQRFETSLYFHYQAGGNGKLSAEKYIAVYLWFAGYQTASFRDVADRFGIAISTLHTVLRKVTYFLSNRADQVIKWPTEEEKLEIQQFFQLSNFPGVVGVIDGTHVTIDRSSEDPDSYLDRKHNFSIQVQLVCDHQRRIRDIFVGFPGSVHDSRVLRSSSLYLSLQEKCGQSYLLGDSGYPCLPNLLTPYKDRGNLTARQRNFNFKLASNRYVIEHCNGILKQKFRQLYHVKLRNMRFLVHFIRACCVLHNLAIDDDFQYNEDEILLQADNPRLNHELEDDEVAADDRNGAVIRDRVCNLLQIG